MKLRQRLPALAAAFALLGCAGGATQSGNSLQSLQDIEDDLRKDPGAERDQSREPQKRDPRSERALQEMLETARARRAAQDEAHAAQPSPDDAQLFAFAETYRPPNEKAAGPVDHYLYGRALLLAGRTSEAQWRYDCALRAEPRFSLARAALGLWHYRFEEWAEAERYLAQAWLEDRADPEVALYLAHTYEKIGQPEKALVLMQQASGAARGEVPAALWLAKYYGDREAPEKVLEVLEPIVAKHPDDVQLRLRLAVAYEEVGRIGDAIAELEKILPRMKDGIWLFYLRQAGLMRRAERFAESGAHLRRVLDDAPVEFFEDELAKGGKEAIEQQLRLVQEEEKRGERLFWSREELIAIIKHHQWNHVEARAAAAQRLIAERPQEDGETLGNWIALLSKDPDPAVRIWAARALKRWAVLAKVENFLIYHAGNARETAAVRAAYCDAFEPPISDKAVDVLLDCLGGEPQLFHAANDALERITELIVVAGDGAYLDDKPTSRLRIQAEWRDKIARWRAQR